MVDMLARVLNRISKVNEVTSLLPAIGKVFAGSHRCYTASGNMETFLRDQEYQADISQNQDRVSSVCDIMHLDPVIIPVVPSAQQLILSPMSGVAKDSI